jgi:D-serine deaminase-like pyridoxal phosphate-dependent protein
LEEDPCLINAPAGNFPTNDLQQVATGLVTESDQAVRICVEVCSVYPERNEALVNAGVIALSRETSTFPGFGMVADHPGWAVVRLSQEHGILGRVQGARVAVPKAEHHTSDAATSFTVGQRLFVYCQHACITAAAFHVYYVVDDEDVVQDTWVPWKGW